MPAVAVVRDGPGVANTSALELQFVSATVGRQIWRSSAFPTMMFWTFGTVNVGVVHVVVPPEGWLQGNWLAGPS